jgi:hypothetical protein
MLLDKLVAKEELDFMTINTTKNISERTGDQLQKCNRPLLYCQRQR